MHHATFWALYLRHVQRKTPVPRYSSKGNYSIKSSESSLFQEGSVVENDVHIVTLIIPSQKGFEKTAMSVLQCLASDMGLSEKKISRLETALAEACLNAMEHGNRFNKALDVTIRFIQHLPKLEITVQDSGIGGHISLPTRPPDIDAKVSGGASKRGWGIFMIRNLVDDFEITPLPKGGNVVRMVSYLEPINEQPNTD